MEVVSTLLKTWYHHLYNNWQLILWLTYEDVKGLVVDVVNSVLAIGFNMRLYESTPVDTNNDERLESLLRMHRNSTKWHQIQPSGTK